MSSSFFDERNACPCCESGGYRELYRKSYHSPEIRTYLTGFYGQQGTAELEYLTNVDYVLCECSACRSIFQRYVPNEELTSRIYEIWISPQNVLQKRASLPLSYYQGHADEISIVASHFGRPPGALSFLDFGMGWGQWALLAKAHGIRTYGTELSSERIDYCKKNGIDIVSWDDIPRYKFDFVNTEQVFEHLSDPLTTLKHLKMGLTERGVVKISVPYAFDIERRIRLMDWTAPKGSRNSINPVAPLEHINYFRRESIIRMGKKAGMRETLIPMPTQYARGKLLSGSIKGIIKNLARPLYKNTRGNYVLLEVEAK
jgi:SAM-dependent methyltransferase